MRYADRDALPGMTRWQTIITMAAASGIQRRRLSADQFREFAIDVYVSQLPKEDPDFLAHCFDAGRLEIEFLSRWALCGLPRVVLGHKHAAALMASDMPDEIIERLESPWDAFVIDVPSGLLSYEHTSSGLHAIEHYAVWFDANGADGVRRLCCDIFPRDTPASGFSQMHPEPLAFHLDLCRDADRHMKGNAKRNARTGMLGIRFVAGVLLELTRHRPARAHAAGPREVKRSFRGDPQTTTFQLVRDVKIDCRQTVRDYCRGLRRGAPSVQHMVRGHWKDQPYGAGGGERRHIFVEPYWRGPEDAPIALRNHVLGGASQ